MNWSPSARDNQPMSAPTSRTALLSTMSRTGWRSNTERLIVFSTSATAIHRPGRQSAAQRSGVGDRLEEAIRAHQRDAAVLSGAEARRVPSDRVEHWLTIGRGACHRAQHVTERGLPLERLLRLVE